MTPAKKFNMAKSIILVPVDDTDVSEGVVQYAASNFYREGDEIRLFHVIPIPMPEYVAGGMDTIVTIDPDPKEDLKHIQDAKAFITRRFLPLLEAKKLPYKVEIVHCLTDEDSIGEAICKRAEKLQPRAVVMAKHQRGRVKEFFLGSAARYTVTRCKYPVMILHDEALGGAWELLPAGCTLQGRADADSPGSEDESSSENEVGSDEEDEL